MDCGKCQYLFADGKLAAVRFEYETRDISYNSLKDTLTKQYGEASTLDTAALGNGIYAVDDDGRPEGRVEAIVSGNVMIVLEQDDDIEVTFVDLTAAYIK